MSATAFDLCLYGVLSPDLTAGRDAADVAAASLRGGVTLVQYRDKTSTTRDAIATAASVLEACLEANVPLLINDRVDIAACIGAAGVHLGEDDMRPEDARRILGPDAIVGVTIHSVAEAEAAPIDVADYYGVGGVYGTSSKVNRHGPIGTDGLAEIAAVLRRRQPGCPIVGIAGIDASNAASVIAAGADGVAVISAIYGAGDPEQAARELRRVIDEAKGR